jgi:uncharacterized protein (TIGR00255 family)
MTGFVSKAVSINLDDTSKVSVTLSIKSLNSRFFETTFKVPYTLSSLETELIKILKTHLVRGHVYCTIHLANQTLVQPQIEPAMSAIKGYLKAVDTIKQECGIAGTVSIDNLLGLPNVFVVQEKEIDPKVTQTILEEMLNLAQSLSTVRAQEGLVLKKDLMQRMAVVETEIQAIEKAALQLLEDQKQKIAQEMNTIDLDETKLADIRKAALYAILDKIDIHEEIVRFKSHMKNIHEQLESATTEKGKKLDFTIQELGREINTIGAKCSDANIGARAINVKVELEKAREQVQNIV